MLPRIRRPIGLQGRRRGVTLLEMLVVVALVVLMMVILVQIFQSATGAMSASRTTQELDVTLRQVEAIIRNDLAGTTAKMTPPNDPKDNRGYFEYGENAPADLQGEDTDDYLAFTTKAPDGEFFTGRQAIAAPALNPPFKIATITSQVAEVVYFLRNGNLYRRVFLVAPERASSLIQGTNSVAGDFDGATFGFNNDIRYFPTNLFGNRVLVSWQGLNDISCRPGRVLGQLANGQPNIIPVPNDLGTLTNRENRIFRPRFANDFTGPSAVGASDGVPDDNNGDGLPDYYPTIYTTGSDSSYVDSLGHAVTAPNPFTYNIYSPISPPANSFMRVSSTSYDTYAFPFIYPGHYSIPGNVASNLGWFHNLFPGQDTNNNYQINHSPIDLGENWVLPKGKQVWWGFPTWREVLTGFRKQSAFLQQDQQNGIPTASQVGWTDPVYAIGLTNLTSQSLGLEPFNPTASPNSTKPNNPITFLPPLSRYATGALPPYTDPNSGSLSFLAIPTAPQRVWEDDLLMTGVRSFDIKAYDPNAALYNIIVNGSYVNGPFSAGYQDLGYGSSQYQLAGVAANPSGSYNYVSGPNGPVSFIQDVMKVNPTYSVHAPSSSQLDVPWQAAGGEPQGFGHEGRIPPTLSDFRMHPRRPTLFDSNNNTYHPNNIGDNSTGVIRLTHVWDSWSTDYTNAPDTDLFLNNASTQTPAIYPSFPPPYPTPLRGIQVQIRLTDARNERAKSITIRVDFTDKLN